MGSKPKYFFKLICCVVALIVFCEFLVYYVILFQCSWPKLDPANEEKSISKGSGKELKVMLLADTHLLGSRKGHWFDKLRREWQMYRAFQTAISLHEPEIIFVLGDIFDEGLWSSEKEFNSYVTRFHSLFRVPSGTEIFVVVGNHDIGFHYGISPYLHERFARSFNAPSVRLLSVEGVHFVLVNSMAMEGDGCFLCRPAELQVNKIAARLQCTRGIGKCKKGISLEQYSRPVLLQHFPMYRESDAECSEPDEAPEDEKKNKFRERWECLSRESSEMLLNSLKPRVIVTGHTHHGCHRYHKDSDAMEYTIPSFSWRNKDNPSFMLAVFTSNNYAVSKCYMPRETTVIKLYIFGIILIIMYAMILYRRHFQRTRFFKSH